VSGAFRVGIVGGGAISDTHARAALAVPGVEVVAWWGANAGRVAALAARHGGTVYDDLAAFVRHQPMDAVFVGSPSGLHAEHALAAVGAGLHVLVEKPLDVRAASADRLVDAADRAGVVAGVFFQDRAAPGAAWLKRLVDGGGLGRPVLASARVRWYRPPEYYAASRWRGTWALDGGGAVMNQGIHTADLLLWLLGDVCRVYAQTRTAVHAVEVEDTAVACLEFAGGAVATFEAATSAYPGFPRRLELTGTGGTVLVEDDRVVAAELRAPPAEPPPNAAPDGSTRATSPVVADARGHQRIVEDFVRAVRTGARPLCDARDGRRSVALVEAMYRSAREGAAVAPEPAP
jgi:predicted dehydrogenase